MTSDWREKEDIFCNALGMVPLIGTTCVRRGIGGDDCGHVSDRHAVMEGIISASIVWLVL